MFATLCLITFSANAQTKKGTVLLGAGSQFSGTSWTDWHITPKIGYFIQDGLAIGAEVNYNSDDEYVDAFDGVLIPVIDPNTDQQLVDPISGDLVFEKDGEHDGYTLTNKEMRFGVFARYYAARNLFVEASLSAGEMETQEWVRDVPVTNITATGGATIEYQDMVMTSSESSYNVRLGMGYTLVWREHFAVEPFVHLDLIVDGERVIPGGGAMQAAETVDLSGSEFIAGVNFSLFF